MPVARVLPNVTGLDKAFDYAVPDALVDVVRIGDVVRVDLHGRRIAGWVVALDAPDSLDPAALKPVTKLTGRGPARDVLELSEWAATRWAARRRHFVGIASPDRAVGSSSSTPTGDSTPSTAPTRRSPPRS